MILVKKENRILEISELEKAGYLSDGYDVVEVENGEYVTVELATGGRTYTVAEYQAIVAERDKALKELAKLKSKGKGGKNGKGNSGEDSGMEQSDEKADTGNTE